MSLRRRQLKRNRYYHCRDEDEIEGPDECWCGVKNPYFADVGGSCAGTGSLTCYCGGDLCVCHNHGEVECFGCPDCDSGDDDDDDYHDHVYYGVAGT